MDYYGLEKEDVMLLGELDKDDAAFIDEAIQKVIDDGFYLTVNRVVKCLQYLCDGFFTEEHYQGINYFVGFYIERHKEELLANGNLNPVTYTNNKIYEWNPLTD